MSIDKTKLLIPTCILSHNDYMMWTYWDKNKRTETNFKKHLMSAIEVADPIDLKKLEYLYPETIKAFRRFKSHDE